MQDQRILKDACNNFSMLSKLLTDFLDVRKALIDLTGSGSK